MESIDKLISEYRAFSIKFAYYFIALNVACIGFSVTQTLDIEPIRVHLIILASVVCFGASVFCGVRFILTFGGSILIDIDVKKVGLGKSEVVQEVLGENYTADAHQQAKNLAINTLRGIADSKSLKTKRSFFAMQLLFYLGAILFLLWRVLVIFNVS